MFKNGYYDVLCKEDYSRAAFLATCSEICMAGLQSPCTGAVNFYDAGYRENDISPFMAKDIEELAHLFLLSLCPAFNEGKVTLDNPKLRRKLRRGARFYGQAAYEGESVVDRLDQGLAELYPSKLDEKWRAYVRRAIVDAACRYDRKLTIDANDRITVAIIPAHVSLDQRCRELRAMGSCEKF